MLPSQALAAYGPFVVAVVAALVGLTQYYLQREKIKLDLFEKRLKVYNAVMEFLEQVYNTGEVSSVHFEPLVDRTKPASFLFGGDVTGYLNVLIKSTHDLQTDLSRLTGTAPRSTNTATVIEMNQRVQQKLTEQALDRLAHWLYPLRQDAETVFHPYLRIYRDTWWITRFCRRVQQWVDNGEALTRDKPMSV